MTKKSAPTTKVENNIEQGLTVDLSNGTTLCASMHEEYFYVCTDPVTGEDLYRAGGGGYSITSHNGLMPAFNSETYDTLQELANAMRTHADLRTWKRS